MPCCCPCLPRPVLGGLAGPVAAALALWRVAHIAGNGRDGGSPWRPTPRRAVRCLSGAQAAAVGCAACQPLAKPVRLIQPGALPGSAAVLVLFAINEIAASAFPARPRGRFAFKRCSPQSSASPGQPLARQAMAAPGAFWRPRFGRGLHTTAKNCAHIFPRRHQAATLAPKPKGPVLQNTFGSAVATPTEKRGFVMPELLGLVRLLHSLSGYGVWWGLPVRMAARLRTCF